MKRKLPADAFGYYLTQGAGRSYRAVADKYGVSKVAVTNLAKRENWQARLAEIDAKARQMGDERAAESLEAIRERHIKAARVVQAKALEALRSMSVDNAMDAIRALDIGMKQERLLLGEATERSALTVEDVVRREYARWMSDADDEGAGNGADEPRQRIGAAS